MPKKLSVNAKILIVVSFVFVVATSVLLANLLTLSLLPAAQPSTAVKANAFEVHILSLGKSQNEKAAASLADDYKKMGAGGYVWQVGDYFYVASSAYINKNDASLVQNNLKNSEIESEIVSVKFPAFTIGGSFESEEKKVLQKVLNLPFNAYSNLYDIAISLDTAVYNEVSAKLAVNAVHSQISSVVTDFETLFAGSDNDVLLKIEKMLKNILSSSNSLIGLLKDEQQTYSSLIKYHYLSFLNEYNNLIKDA